MLCPSTTGQFLKACHTSHTMKTQTEILLVQVCISQDIITSKPFLCFSCTDTKSHSNADPVPFKWIEQVTKILEILHEASQHLAPVEDRRASQTHSMAPLTQQSTTSLQEYSIRTGALHLTHKTLACQHSQLPRFTRPEPKTTKYHTQRRQAICKFLAQHWQPRTQEL